MNEILFYQVIFLNQELCWLVLSLIFGEMAKKIHVYGWMQGINGTEWKMEI